MSYAWGTIKTIESFGALLNAFNVMKCTCVLNEMRRNIVVWILNVPPRPCTESLVSNVCYWEVVEVLEKKNDSYTLASLTSYV